MDSENLPNALNNNKTASSAVNNTLLVGSYWFDTVAKEPSAATSYGTRVFLNLLLSSLRVQILQSHSDPPDLMQNR